MQVLWLRGALGAKTGNTWEERSAGVAGHGKLPRRGDSWSLRRVMRTHSALEGKPAQPRNQTQLCVAGTHSAGGRAAGSGKVSAHAGPACAGRPAHLLEDPGLNLISEQREARRGSGTATPRLTHRGLQEDRMDRDRQDLGQGRPDRRRLVGFSQPDRVGRSRPGDGEEEEAGDS